MGLSLICIKDICSGTHSNIHGTSEFTAAQLLALADKLYSMCIRYDADTDRIVAWSKVVNAWIPVEDWKAGRNVFPGQKTPILLHHAEHGQELVKGQWGMIPVWAKDAKFGRSNGYNARSETLQEKPTWRDPLKCGRCIVPATGYYERNFEEQRWLKFQSSDVMLFAGLFTGPTRHCDLPSFAMVTTEPNRFVEDHHDRMPVILSVADARAWLNPETSIPECMAMLEPCPEDWLTMEDAGPILKPGDFAKAFEWLSTEGFALEKLPDGRWRVDDAIYNDEQLVEFRRSLDPA